MIVAIKMSTLWIQKNVLQTYVYLHKHTEKHAHINIYIYINKYLYMYVYILTLDEMSYIKQNRKDITWVLYNLLSTFMLSFWLD